MLSFNQFLRAGGIDPAEVRLARHYYKGSQRLLYDAAMSRDPRFGQYQERQGTLNVIAQFRKARFVAGFVVEPGTGLVVFAGVFELLGERKEHLDNPFKADPPATKAIEFVSRRIEAFDIYVGRLVIEWGDGARAWVQHASRRDKPIVELRQALRDPEFPGFLRFATSLDQIDQLCQSWIQVLRHARGVYLLVHRDTGAQYVGSAYGGDGFFGRWIGYRDGHGGNRGMRELAGKASEYDVTILEVAGSDATFEDICQRESLWKSKLGTRASGLNRN